MKNNSQNLNNDGGISLESILAEYKNNALITGEKKTSKEKLDHETDKILNESAELSDMPEDADANIGEKDDSEHEQESVRFSYCEEDMNELEKEFFGVGRYARESVSDFEVSEETVSTKKDNTAPVEAVREGETTPERKRKRFMAARIGRENEKGKPEEVQADAASGEFEDIDEDPEEEELEPAEAARVYGATLNSLFTRGLAASFIGIIMLYLTFASGFGFSLPAFLAGNYVFFSSVLLLLLLFVMLMGLDILIVGVKDILRLKPGAESLVVTSCIVSVLDSVVSIITKTAETGIPYSSVSALSMVFAIWGLRYTRLAMRATLSTASISANPYVVSNRNNMVADGAVTVKSPGITNGFTRKAEQADLGESTFALSSPMFMVAALVLAVLSSVIQGRAGTFLHCWSALSAVASQFSMLFVFGFPFHIISAKLMRSGAAVAGWAGACDINSAVGVVVKDEDIFPTGTLSMNGIRIFKGVSMQKAVSYTGSLIIASGSGLSGIFRDLMSQQGSRIIKVEDLACYEAGGIGASIAGEQVLVGSSGFMNLMGIRLPQELNVKNAVFSAINNEFVGIFAINYTPVSSVQNALVALLQTKIVTMFAVRDFNVSPLMLTQKFKVSVDKAEFMTVDGRYRLSEQYAGDAEPNAVLCREGLGPFAEAVMGSKRLVKVVRCCTLLSLLGALIGTLIMFYLCWSGDFTAASAANTLLYMFMWMIPVLLLGNSAGMY